jgi:hypothetical protein
MSTGDIFRNRITIIRGLGVWLYREIWVKQKITKCGVSHNDIQKEGDLYRVQGSRTNSALRGRHSCLLRTRWVKKYIPTGARRLQSRKMKICI